MCYFYTDLCMAQPLHLRTIESGIQAVMSSLFLYFFLFRDEVRDCHLNWQMSFAGVKLETWNCTLIGNEKKLAVVLAPGDLCEHVLQCSIGISQAACQGFLFLILLCDSAQPVELTMDRNSRNSSF